MMYNKIVQEYFFLPIHVGLLDLNHPYTVHFRSNQNQMVTDMYMQCAEDGLITKVCFKTNGNPYVIAALEWLCRETKGKRLQTLSSYNYQQLIDVLEIPTTQYPIALHIEDIYKEVLALMKKKFEGNNDD